MTGRLIWRPHSRRTNAQATYLGDFDGGSGDSYSEQELLGKGLGGGVPVTHDGITYTWPDVGSGQRDNVVACGQTVSFTGSGSRLGILAAATYYCFTGSGCSNGTARGTVTVTYTDGTTSRAPISVADWYANQATPGCDILVTTPDWNEPVGVVQPPSRERVCHLHPHRRDQDGGVGDPARRRQRR